MAEPSVNFGFSSCPNDTFAFHALVHHLIPGVRVTPFIEHAQNDVQRTMRAQSRQRRRILHLRDQPIRIALPRFKVRQIRWRAVGAGQW